jgi:hypothetical protein
MPLLLRKNTPWEVPSAAGIDRAAGQYACCCFVRHAEVVSTLTHCLGVQAQCLIGVCAPAQNLLHQMPSSLQLLPCSAPLMTEDRTPPVSFDRVL